MYKLLLVTLLLLPTVLFSQNQEREIDSLLKVAEKSNDSIWYETHREISFYYIFNNPKKSDSLIKLGLSKAKAQENELWETRFEYTYGVLMDVTAQLDSARYYFKRSLERSKRNNFEDIVVKANNGLGMNHWNRREYEEALSYFFEALDGNKKVGSEQEGAKYLNNIGLIYQEMNIIPKALNYHEQALTIRKKYKLNRDIPSSLNNLAICHRMNGEIEKAKSYALDAIAIAEKENVQPIRMDALGTLSNIYADNNEVDKVIPILEEVINYNDSNNLVSASTLGPMSNLINAYNTINRADKALSYVQKINALMKDFPQFATIFEEYYFNSAQTYFMLGDLPKGEEMISRGLRIKDSVFSVENAQSMAALDTKFQLSEQKRNLAETRANLAESKLKIRRRNMAIFGGFGLLLLTGLIGYLVYSKQRLKNRQLQKESELRSALALIETQNKLQQQRLRISRDLHDNIGAQLTFVTSSVENLKYGLKDKDKTTVAKLSNIRDFTTQTIYELRDTIWAMNKQEITFEDLQTRIANFIEKAGAARDEIDFNFQNLVQISNEKKFSSIQGMNLYRIIQESVNNALKYADASNITIRLQQQNEQYCLSISDNGKGFDLDEIEQGHGLNNIRKRARDLDGEVQITSAEGQGTLVELIF